ncbi:glycosyltransferase [Anaerospora sp.]|uniref:glycosyltransferase n=1 Tax=Anaerospora sp. TaxID=1960278 RepID=UPI0028A1604B|nr:glycosyltransferase [Anaerospora sp.]
MKIGLFSAYDNQGAGNAALRLHNGLNQIGQDSTMFVKYKSTNGTSVINLTSPDTHNIVFDSLVTKYFFNNIYEGNTICSVLYPSVGFDFLSSIKDLDVINLHWVTQFLSLEAVVHIRQMGKPVIWTLHDQNLMTGGCHYDHGCEKYKRDCSGCPQLKENPFNITQTILAAKKRYLPKDIVIVTPSRWLADCARESTVLKEHRIEVIPNSLDTQSFLAVDKKTAKRFFDIPKTAKVILFGAVSLKERRKGFSELLTSMELLCEDQQIASLINNQQIFILLFGESSPLIENLGVPYRALGYLKDNHALNMAYSAADVLALPSLEDNLPNVMLESMACGTPVVAFDIGGMSDVIQNGENGYLASSGNCQQFAQRLKEVLLGSSMQSFCRQFSEEQFALEVQAKRYSGLFEDVVKTSRPTISMHVPVMFPEISEAIMPWIIDISKDISFTCDEQIRIAEMINLRNKRLLIWGTGNTAQELFEQLKLQGQDNLVVGFIDNNRRKWDYLMYNRPIYSPMMLNDPGADYAVIIASMYYAEIGKQLEAMGFTAIAAKLYCSIHK